MGIFKRVQSRLDKSGDLVFGMSRRLGVDLGHRVVHDPEAEARRLRTMLFRCAQCTNQEGCAHLQDRFDTLEDAPGYCMNKRAFQDMERE